MTIHLSFPLFLPLATALVAAFLPARIGRWLVVAGTVAVLGYAVALVFDFDSADAGLQYVTDDEWIAELGIRYQLGVDGLNLFLILTTALLWVPATVWAAVRETERTKLYLFHLALGETAILGAFMAQDLALFVVFFDLMLVPFYFLIGGWGHGDRVAATTKFVIFTLFGSLLMLAAAIALGVLATPDGGSLSYSLADLQQRTVGEGTQNWIFLLFALAFLIKAPLFPFHGWVVDTYRATPTPVLVLLSAIMSKVGVYGFLRIVLPILPDASVHFQDLILALAVFSILYGSILAFSQDRAAAGGGLLVDRAAGLHLPGHLQPGREGRPGRADADGQPRAGHRGAVLHHRRAHGAGQGPGHARAPGRHGLPRARAGHPVPGGRAGHAGHARHAQLRRRDPDPVRRHGGQAGVRRRGLDRRRAGRRLHDPDLPALDAQPRGRGHRVA